MSKQTLQVTYPRGSEWRKWDLQVHTPYSALNNGFGTDFQIYAKQLLEKASKDEIAVVGITDYFMIQGYRELRELLADEAKLNRLVGGEMAESAARILFIPNIELRTSIIVRNPKGADSRVNFHVFFSDTVSPDDIEEHFLRELKFTAEANPDSKDERWSLTSRNLAELGKRLKEQHEKFRQHNDLFVGMMNAVVDHSEVSEILENKPSIFKDRYLLCLPCDEDLSKCSWDGQGHLARKLLIQKSHMLLSANAGTRAFALGKKHTSTDEFKAEFKGLKPCIHSSDAHTYDELFSPAEDHHTWIKADPTFYGLRQILNEPEDRVFVGEDLPPSIVRVNRKATRVARSVEVRKLAEATTTEKWFDFELPLNAELVAVIGNKGSGKSALSDILGLLGNTPRYDSFSFLKDDRFRRSKNNNARQFHAFLKWADDKVDEAPSLGTNPSPDAVEKIKYIPQHYLEEICNEIGSGKGGRFYNELQQVIFSHVPEAEKLGFGTLDELLAHRSEETNKAIEQFVRELQECNGAIVDLEERLSPQHRKSIEAQLVEKNRELGAHVPPKEVPKPGADPAAQQQSKAAAEELENKLVEIKTLEGEVAALHTSDALAAKKRSTAEKLAGKIKNLHRQVDVFLMEAKPDFDELSLNQNKIVTLTIDTTLIDTLLKSLESERATIAAKLDPYWAGSPEARRKAVVDLIEGLQAQLSAPQRFYQAYLQTVKEWEVGKTKIIGTDDVVGSIKYLQKQLSDLDGLPAQLKILQKQRDRKLLEIFREKQKLRTYYEMYYGEVQSFLKLHPLADGERFQLTFNVSMAERGFSEVFLGRLNRRKVGPFMGDEEGSAEMKRLLANANFDTALGTLRFTRVLFNKMNERDGKPLLLKEQLKQGASALQELYDFVFSLSFLSPIYNLRWDGKGLEQLSPGERGNLLLIFYLLVDQDDIPLVIDQPEENLDNQTVFKTLVPCIKDAKKRRQIIMVTHNPNLAVVCDAEQIICAEMRKNHDNAVTYISGSIEDPAINRRIVDILEGTRPAFDKRDDKYIP